MSSISDMIDELDVADFYRGSCQRKAAKAVAEAIQVAKDVAASNYFETEVEALNNN